MDPQNRLICMTPLTPLQSLDGYQEFSQQEAVDSRPESAPPSVELQMEPYADFLPLNRLVPFLIPKLNPRCLIRVQDPDAVLFQA